MKANINGTIQDYKPRPIPKGLIDGEIKTNGVIITPFDSKVLTAVAVIGENTDEAAFLDTDIYPVMGIGDTPENRERVEASISKLQKAGLLTVENVFSWGENEDHAQGENVTLTREALRVYRAACIVAGASPDNNFSTDEVFHLLHENGGDTPFDYEIVRYHLEELNNHGLFNLEDEEPAQGAKNDSFSRLMQRHKEWGLVEDNAHYDGGELETINACIARIELFGDNKADREKATKAARRLLSNMEERLINLKNVLSDLESVLGVGVVPF